MEKRGCEKQIDNEGSRKGQGVHSTIKWFISLKKRIYTHVQMITS